MTDVVAILGRTLQLYTVNAMLFIKVNMKSIYFHNIHACLIVQDSPKEAILHNTPKKNIVAFVIFHHNAITCLVSVTAKN